MNAFLFSLRLHRHAQVAKSPKCSFKPDVHHLHCTHCAEIQLDHAQYVVKIAQFVSFRFVAFLTTYSYDYVTLYDGGSTSNTVIARLSGQQLNLEEIYITTQPLMLVTFVSGSGIAYSGFNGTFWTSWTGIFNSFYMSFQLIFN